MTRPRSWLVTDSPWLSFFFSNSHCNRGERNDKTLCACIRDYTCQNLSGDDVPNPWWWWGPDRSDLFCLFIFFYAAVRDQQKNDSAVRGIIASCEINWMKAVSKKRLEFARKRNVVLFFFVLVTKLLDQMTQILLKKRNLPLAVSHKDCIKYSLTIFSSSLCFFLWGNLRCNCGTVPQLHLAVGCQWTPPF